MTLTGKILFVISIRESCWMMNPVKNKNLHSSNLLLTIIIFLLFLVLTACETPQVRSRKRMRSLENGLIKAVVLKSQTPEKMKLFERMQYYRVPGVSIAVIYKQQLDWAKAYGVNDTEKFTPITSESLFQAGTLSQPVSALAALRYVEEGRLGLDSDLNEALSSWKVPDDQYPRESKVTLRRLLGHSAGLFPFMFEGYPHSMPLPSLLMILNGEKPAISAAVRLADPPGSKLVYSESNYAVLQQVLVDLEKKPFPAIMEETVFKRLGMLKSTFDCPLPPGLREKAVSGHLREGPIEGKWYRYPVKAAKGLWTTPTDLVLFVIEVMKAALGESQKIVSPPLVQEMLTPQVENHGLGFFIEDKGDDLIFYSRGSNDGFECFMVGYPVRGEGAVVMTNSVDGSYLIDEILRGISAVYDWPHFKPEVRTLYRLDRSMYAQYEGKYEVNPDYVLTVAHENYYLIITPTGQAPTKFYVQSANVFFSTDPYILIRFIRNEEGKITGLTLSQRGQVIKARKIE